MSKLGVLSIEIANRFKNIALPRDAAGHKATTKVPLALTKQTVGDVREILFDHAADFESINYIYAVSARGRLHGVFSIKEVFKNPPETPVKKIMTEKLITAHPKDDQEKVAHLAIKNGVKAVPLVDKKGYFLGVVASDTIQEILDTESKEDLLKLSGIIGKPHKVVHEASVFTSFSRRIPWIIVGLLGGTITASTIGGFQKVLAQNLVLASFIPLIAYIANAVANQTQTLFIRDLATQLGLDFKKYLAKQLATTVFIALTCWALILVLTGIFWNSFTLGAVIGLAMTLAILTATLLGLLIPKTISYFRLDPAIGGGPFATVIQDFLSVTIYFTIASVLL